MVWNGHRLVADELGEPDGILRSDELGFVKKGRTPWGAGEVLCLLQKLASGHGVAPKFGRHWHQRWRLRLLVQSSRVA